jgi:hypothetical protein
MLINDGIKIPEGDVETWRCEACLLLGMVAMLRQQFNSVMLMAAARLPGLFSVVASQHTRSATCLQYAQLRSKSRQRAGQVA